MIENGTCFFRLKCFSLILEENDFFKNWNPKILRGSKQNQGKRIEKKKKKYTHHRMEELRELDEFLFIAKNETNEKHQKMMFHSVKKHKETV